MFYIITKWDEKREKIISLVEDRNKMHKKDGKTKKFKIIALIIQLGHQTCMIKIVIPDKDLGLLIVGKEHIAKYEHLVKIKKKNN